MAPFAGHLLRSQCTDDSILTASHFVYSLFGLQIHSNLAVPEISSVLVKPVDGADRERTLGTNPRVEIHFKASPDSTAPRARTAEERSYTSDYKDNAGNPALTIWKVSGGRFLRLEYFDGTQFWLNREGSRIWATWPENLTIEDTATYLLGPVLGLLLRLRGVTCLHASAVSFGDCAVGFVGSEGAGKSTTAAVLAQQGCAVISDDVVALAEHEGSFYVHPAYPYLCLWPESTQAIYGSAEALPRFSQNYEKRCLSLEKQRLPFESRLLPLRAVYVLGNRRPDPAPTILAMSAQKSILALVANTFATNLLDGPMRAKEFETLGRLVPLVRVREVFPHTDASRLPDLCRQIRREVDAIGAQRLAPPEISPRS